MFRGNGLRPGRNEWLVDWDRWVVARYIRAHDNYVVLRS